MKYLTEYMKKLFSRKVVAYSLIIAFIFSLGYLAGNSQWTGGNISVELGDGFRFDPSVQRSVDKVLARADLTDHQWVGDRLQVPKDKLFFYIAALADYYVFPTNRYRDHFFPRTTVVDSDSPFHNAKIMHARMNAATERATADAIKLLPGIADAQVKRTTRVEWGCMWSYSLDRSVVVTLETMEDKPLDVDVLVEVRIIVASAFRHIAWEEINIVDARNNRLYDEFDELADVGLLH